MFVVWRNEVYWLEDNRIPMRWFDDFKRQNPKMTVKVSKDKRESEIPLGELEDYAYWRNLI